MEEPKDKEKKYSRNYVQWTPEMDRALLDVLVEHHNNADHAQNGWKSHVYKHAIKNVLDKCGVTVTKEKIVSRCKTFDKHYEIVSKILAQSGFGWDSERNVLLLDSEEVWERYVEANEKAAIYKNKVIHNWNQICEIYSKDHVNGEGAKTGAETAKERQTEVVQPAAHVIDTSPELAGPSPKRLRTGEAIMCMLGEMKTSFNDAMKSTEPLPMPKATPPTILAELDAIPELSRSDKLRAYGKLIASERVFEALMELPMEFRKEWLLTLN